MKNIIKHTDHRPWPIPHRPWVWYQEWNNAVFIHARVERAWLVNNVPAGLALDTFGGDAWVSIVPFRMQKIRPRFLPHFNAISDFYEINIRTYVVVDNKPGVFFLSIEAGKRLSGYIAKTISGLPYRYQSFIFDDHHLAAPWLYFDYNILEKKDKKNAFDLWVTERYCLYYNNGSGIYRYNIHHLPWPLQSISVNNFQTSHPVFKTMENVFKPEICHYSPGVKVIAWTAERVL